MPVTGVSRVNGQHAQINAQLNGNRDNALQHKHDYTPWHIKNALVAIVPQRSKAMVTVGTKTTNSKRSNVRCSSSCCLNPAR